MTLFGISLMNIFMIDLMISLAFRFVIGFVIRIRLRSMAGPDKCLLYDYIMKSCIFARYLTSVYNAGRSVVRCSKLRCQL